MALRLTRRDLGDDPIEQFRSWYDSARAAGQPEPEAMALATVGDDGFPAVRFVLMRGLDERGFVFYTNRRSRKGVELTVSPRAAGAFRWKTVDRQVRVVGAIEEIDDSESDSYFASRPRGSQVAAWASDQSQPVADRDELERRYMDESARFEGADVPRPPWWGGYRIRPSEVEFWQEGEFRMHDRFRYHRQGPGEWQVERLQP